MVNPDHAKALLQEVFKQGPIIELADPHDEVLKFLPPRTTEDVVLEWGVGMIANQVDGLIRSQ